MYAVFLSHGEYGHDVRVLELRAHLRLTLTDIALSGSGIAVQGAHLIDPRTGAPSPRATRTWALAPTAALSDALSTAFFIFSEEEIAAFCAAHPEIGGASAGSSTQLNVHGALARYPATASV